MGRRRSRGLFAVPINIYLLVVLIVTAALLHVTWLPVAPLGARPDLMLVIITLWSLLRGIEEGLLWAFLGGALLDLMSGGPFGAFTLALLTVALLAGGIQRVVFGAGLLLPAAALVAATFLFHLVYLVTLAVTGYAVDWSATPGIMGRSLGWNVVLLLLLARPATWLHRRTGPIGMDV